MSHSSTLPSPNSLPACFPLFLAVALLHALPRPNPKQPAVNRSQLDGAFALIRDLAPRDLIEAHLVLQIAVLMHQAPQVHAMASAHQGEPKAFERFERQGLSMTRCMLRLQDRLRDYRREGRPAVEGAPWEYNLAEMEAIWWEGAEVEEDAASVAGGAAPVEADDGLVASTEPDALIAAAEAVVPPMSRQQGRAPERMQQKAARPQAAVAARELARAA
jgi:hypothetical protein